MTPGYDSVGLRCARVLLRRAPDPVTVWLRVGDGTGRRRIIVVERGAQRMPTPPEPRSPDEPTILHGPSLDLEWDSLDPINGYNIVRVTADNAEKLGYPRSTTPGLKVRYLREHLADVTTLREATEVIAERLARHLVLVEEPQPYADMWETALLEPLAAFRR